MEYLDMLAKLGVGNAHPGGFAATLRQLEQYPLPPGSRILEVGCGTGRTACYLASQGHEVTGLDIRPEMIAKAKLRAEKERAAAHFIEGDACALPFPDRSFDVILVESVSIFTDTCKAFTEYCRALRDGGRLYDREMVQLKAMPEHMNEEITRFYQVERIRDLANWEALVKKAGFEKQQLDGPFPFPDISEDLVQYPDDHQLIDPGSFTDPDIWEVTSAYNRIMEQYREYIGYVLICGTK